MGTGDDSFVNAFDLAAMGTRLKTTINEVSEEMERKTYN